MICTATYRYPKCGFKLAYQVVDAKLRSDKTVWQVGMFFDHGDTCQCLDGEQAHSRCEHRPEKP